MKVLLVVIVSLFLLILGPSPAQSSRFEPLRDIARVVEHVGLGRKVQHEDEFHKRDLSDERCVNFCHQDFTACGVINHPLWPVGLNLSNTEPAAQSQLSLIDNPFLPALCKRDLSLLVCARAYPSCATADDGTISKVLPCRSLCQNVHESCGAILAVYPDQDVLDCQGQDNGEPRYVDDDGSDNCFYLRAASANYDPREACYGNALDIDVDTILPNTTVVRSEVVALATFWKGTLGDRWTRRGGWGAGDPCTWEGITCTKLADNITDTISRMSFPSNNLRGSISDNIANLKNLKYLDLSQNMLTGTIPDDLSNLLNLEYLSLAENLLSGTIPNSLENLHKLVSLNLGCVVQTDNILARLSYFPANSNSISGTLPGSVLLGMPNLEYLNLCSNHMEGVLPAELGEMTSLRTLHLQANRFTGLGFTFDKLVNLIDFDVAKNQISAQLPTSISASANLQVFSIVTNKFYGAIPSAFATLSHLTQFGCLYNQLVGSIDNLLGLTNLETIGVGYNSFEGTVESFCGFPHLSILNTIGNRFTGSIPACIGSLSQLYVLDLSNLPLHGTIPAEIGNLRSLVLMAIDNSNLEGTLPPELGGMSSMSTLYISSMPNVVGSLPPEWSQMASLSTISMFGLGLNGSIPEEFCSLENVEQILLYENKLTGSIPNCINRMTKLSTFDVSSNRLTGTIPDSIGELLDLAIFRVQSNQITGTIPASLSNLAGLEILDVAYNNIQQSLVSIMQILQRVTYLTTLNLANNNISGTIDYFMFFDVGGGGIFTKLIDLNFGGNRIEGVVGNVLSVFPALSKVDISNNLFSGEITALPPSVTALLADRNTALIDKRGALPFYLKPTDTYVKDSSGTFSCPALTGTSSSIIVQLDPSYYNYSTCICEPGYYGHRNKCSLCLANGDCTTDTTHQTMVVAPGYYPTPSAENPEMLISCPQDTFSQNPCNPNRVHPFECLKGHTGRVCSQCQPGYRRDGRKCAECNPATKVATIFFGFFAIILLYTYLLWPRTSITESGLLKNFLFYTQATSIVLDTTARWADPIPLLKQIYTGTNFNIGFLGFDCVAPSFTPLNEFLVTMLLPFIFLALSFIVYVGIMVYQVFVRRSLFASSVWRHRSIFAYLFVINALYFPLVSNVLSAFSCTADPITGKKYLDMQPYLECSYDDEQYRGIFILAIVFCIPYIVGIPVLFYYMLRYYQQLRYQSDDNKKQRVITICGFFILCYKEEVYWWEGVIFARRVIFSIFISLIPFTSPFLSLAIFILILLSILVNSWMHPFVMKITNLLDLCGFGVILLTFLSGILFSAPDFREYAVQLAVTVFVLNAIIVAFYVVSYVSVVVNTRLKIMGRGFDKEKMGWAGKVWMGLIDNTNAHMNVVKVKSFDARQSELYSGESSVGVSLSEFSASQNHDQRNSVRSSGSSASFHNNSTHSNTTTPRNSGSQQNNSTRNSGSQQNNSTTPRNSISQQNNSTPPRSQTGTPRKDSQTNNNIPNHLTNNPGNTSRDNLLVENNNTNNNENSNYSSNSDENSNNNNNNANTENKQQQHRLGNDESGPTMNSSENLLN